MPDFLPLLLLKLLLVPILIALVTLAGRRWGPGIAGWLSAFPIVSGPILLVIALEQGADFAATAAANTLLAVFAILVFSIAYARCAHLGMPRAMTAALLAYAGAVLLLQSVTLPLWAGFAFIVGALAGAPALFGRMPAQAAAGKPARDLPWRMLAGALLALGVTCAAATLGARLSGLFAMFPVMSTVLVGFSHRASGPGFAVALLRGMVNGYYAFAVFCVVLSLLLRAQPIGVAFLVATGNALVVQLAVKHFVQRAAVWRAAACRPARRGLE
ncbi:hypothetical protein [Massilia yuzhufengensis]|uniref:Uncharacterized protein n=1 Tax=Massilia yuzhufengensis TaxID=1164594 RepID=A0A1I1NQG1_9BURK|nr:hypothetical protein [Massilia yuzhufengensis]SFC95960.1 hypothetical protein SAMN05216204_11348 [Massilia yuzhufengensis]